jgi:hypothetical protein
MPSGFPAHMRSQLEALVEQIADTFMRLQNTRLIPRYQLSAHSGNEHFTCLIGIAPSADNSSFSRLFEGDRGNCGRNHIFEIESDHRRFFHAAFR